MALVRSPSFQIACDGGHPLVRRPHQLTFRHPDPGYGDLYRQLFGCPVEFSQPENVLTGDVTALQLHQQHADRGMLAVFTQMADELASGARRTSLARRVGEVLRLPHGPPGTRGEVG